MKKEKPKLFIFSGAGLSAESGLATFRDNDGVWRKFDFNIVCNFNTWEEHREEVFDFYANRRKDMLSVKPNEAHLMIARLQQKFSTNRVKIFTQNGDTLLEQAGATEVCHLHGNIMELRCVSCNHWFTPTKEYSSKVACPVCGSEKKVKPGVAFFNEDCPNYDDLFLFKKQVKPQDIVIVVGTSFNVIDIEKFLPQSRYASKLNYQINIAPEHDDWFGKNIEMSASSGFSALHKEIELLMEDSIASRFMLSMANLIEKINAKTQELKSSS